MYPDLLDIKNSAQRIGLTLDPKSVYADVVLASRFIEFAKHRCYSHGKHTYIDAAALKAIVSEWTERLPTNEEILLALRFVQCKTSPTKVSSKAFGKSFKQLTIKFPPLDRIKEYATDWELIRERTEKEIAVELSESKYL